MNGNMIPRRHVLTAALNTTWDDWATDCWEVNNKFGQNQKHGDVKTHEYVLSFDQRDGLDHGLTLEKALQIGVEFAAENFPGHQVLIAAHMAEEGNFDVHICINSTRMLDEPKQDFMKKSCEYKAGKKHCCSDGMMIHLKQSTMDLCRAGGLYQVDLLSGPSDPYNNISDREYNQVLRGQKKLDAENRKKEANGEQVQTRKYETQKEELRKFIREATSHASDFEDLKIILWNDFGVKVTESRGKISYTHPDRNKPTRAEKLGEGYTRESIEEQIRSEEYEPKSNIDPEERKEDFMLRYGTWSAWYEEEYPRIDELKLPETEVIECVFETSRDLHTAIKGIAEAEGMRSYSLDARIYANKIEEQAYELMENPCVEERIKYLDMLQQFGKNIAEKFQYAEEVKVYDLEAGAKKSAEYKALELYGRDTRAIFCGDYHILSDIWDKWENEANIQRYWNEYRAACESFESIQSSYIADMQDEIIYATGYWVDSEESYNAAYRYFRSAQDPIEKLIGLLWLIYETVQFGIAHVELYKIEKEYKEIQRTVHDYYSFKKSYVEALRSGKTPRATIVNGLSKAIETLKEEHRNYEERKYGKEFLERVDKYILEHAKKYSQEQQATSHRQDWKIKQFNEITSLAKKHRFTIDNTPAKIEEYGRALGAAREEAKKAEEKVEKLTGTANAAKDYLKAAEFIAQYEENPEDETKRHYYEDYKDVVATFNYARDILAKRGIQTTEAIEKFLKEYEQAEKEYRVAKKEVEVSKKYYSEACKFRDTVFKVYQRNGIYLPGFDKSRVGKNSTEQDDRGKVPGHGDKRDSYEQYR